MKKIKFPTRWGIKMPPKAWFTYTETNAIPLSMRFRLWWNFFQTISGSTPILDAHFSRLRPEAWQRLARLGAVFPSNFQSPEIRELLSKPLHVSMDQPSFPKPVDLKTDETLRMLLGGIAVRKGKSQKVVDQVYRRLYAAQKP